MNKYRIKKKKPKGKFKIHKRVPITNILFFLIFEFIFTACIFPFLLLYGPFNNAKSAYVGAAMTSMSHQYLAKWFLSDEKIAEILGQNSSGSANEVTSETTDTSEIQLSSVKDDTIEAYEIADNPKFTGYYLVIKDPTRVKIGYTSKLKVEGETTSQIAENNEAIAAINGGAFVDKSSESSWTGTGGYPDGIVMSDGKIIYNSLDANSKTALFGITKSGKMVVGDYSQNELEKLGVQEALSFGPVLTVNGKKTNIQGDGGGGVAPRAAIGQKQDGAIILMVIDGRSLTSVGATYKEVQDLMYKLGAINSINLDGGKSTTMYYGGDIINNPSNSMGERLIPTAVIVK